MKKNVLRLQQLINQMLDLGKLEAGQEKVNLQTTELNTFLTQMIQNLNPLLDEKNQKIRITIPAENHIVSLDADKLEKILSNLISNAIKYSSPNDQIHFTALLEDGLLTVQVQDEGPGIDSADLPFIFQRFYRASTGKSRFEKGTGVGLALVKELTDLLGGKIQVESHKGKGSTFTLKMPLEIISDKKTDAETLRDSDPEAMSQVLSGAEQGSILIVEDNPDLRSYLGQILSPGYQLSFCGNGLEAWIKLTAGLSPDLIVSDVMMPNMDGYELCKKVKTHPGTSHIPVVLLTAKASLQAKIEGLKKGADVYLSKPFHPEELLLTIKNQQTLRRSYRKVFENLVTLENPDENHKNQIPENLQDDYDLIQGLNTFLESQHSDSELTLEKICKKAGIGKTHLTHKFSTLTGYTPMQYLRNLRLEKAKTLLLESKKSVSDIAYTVGFNDPKYFSRQFQQKFGAFPTEWRQSGQDN